VKLLPSISDQEVTLQFSIRDTGIGITETDQKNLFQNFSQVDTNNSRRYGGTGLGLSICKQLVEMMGGTIFVKSHLGDGAEFIFTTTMKKSTSTIAALGSKFEPAELHPNKRLKILVAEDDAINRDVLLWFLTKAGWDADFVFNGRDALSKIEQDRSHYDLILMDCEMPIMDGIAACESIRKIEKKSGLSPLPIIALTAHVSTSYLKKCIDSGMNDCICKPISYEQLHSTILRLTT